MTDFCGLNLFWMTEPILEDRGASLPPPGGSRIAWACAASVRRASL
jgi:hypothetical protein